MSSSEDDSGVDVPIPNSATLPDEGQHTERIFTNKGPREFLVVDLGNYDTLHLYALDHLSCPAMATQCERVFSAARRTLTPERNALGLKVLEACECLRWWWRSGVISGKVAAVPNTPRSEIEAQSVNALLGDLRQDVE
jgi:hAT family C-terminal dimerisation region